MSNIKELIRREIERRKNKAETIRERGVYLELLSFLDTLEEPVSDCHDLEEAARAYSEEVTDGHNYRDLTCGFIAGAEWQKAKMISALKNDGDLPIEFIDKFHEIDRTAFQNGQVNMREQMMEGAVEGLICATITGTNAISFLSPLPKELTAGSEVRIIILPKEDE